MARCEAFRTGCTNEATHTVKGYDLCLICAQAFAGYTPPEHADIIYAQQLRERIDQLEAENGRLREGMAAAYARAAMIADEVAATHAKVAPQGRFTADYRAGAVDAARHVGHLIRKAAES